LACEAAFPQRVVAASCLAGLAPYDAQGLDWYADMGEFNVEDYKLMLRNQSEWEIKSQRDADIMANETGTEISDMLDTLLCKPDKEVLSDVLVGFLHEQSQEAYKVGIRGACDDALSFCRTWGFDLSSISIPIQIWHGRYDKLVPFSHGKWLAANIPYAEVHLENDEGHLSLFDKKVPNVHQWLATKF
jgi:pimeloyl-ACP methyl ester carboxylesterase